ncbi:MAG: hypothetical protein NTW78_00945 [Campylobacterales bacterium]|nr:hypothetical protein [Campylobacterales bacterium]
MKYENIKEEIDGLTSSIDSINKEELKELAELIEQMQECESIKCIEKISHTLTNIHMLKIFVKIKDNKIVYFKDLIKQKKLELKQLEQELKDFNK